MTDGWDHIQPKSELRQAAQQALDALEMGCTDHDGNPVDLVGPAITALRAALEPVTDCYEKEGDNLSPTFDRSANTGKTTDHFRGATEMVATINGTETVEPVAYMMVNKTHGHASSLHFTAPENWHVTWEAVPLYVAPPKREPLTDEEIIEIFISHVRNKETFARAIERAHGIGSEE